MFNLLKIKMYMAHAIMAEPAESNNLLIVLAKIDVKSFAERVLAF